MIINKIIFQWKDKNKQLNNNQNQTKNSEFAILKLELILESSINNQQFVCRKKNKSRTRSKN